MSTAKTKSKSKKSNPNLFTKIGTVLAFRDPEHIEPSKKEHDEFWKDVIAREQEEGNPEPSIDTDIWKSVAHRGLMVGFKKDIASTIYRFSKKTSRAQVIREAKRKKMLLHPSWKTARAIFKAAILNGEVDQKGTEISVYFNVYADVQIYYFRAFRYNPDHGNAQLFISLLSIDESDANNDLLVGDGVCFPN